MPKVVYYEDEPDLQLAAEFGAQSAQAQIETQAATIKGLRSRIAYNQSKLNVYFEMLLGLGIPHASICRIRDGKLAVGPAVIEDPSEVALALRDLFEDYGFSDSFYRVKERLDFSSFEGDWIDHPAMVRYGEICETLKKVADTCTTPDDEELTDAE